MTWIALTIILALIFWVGVFLYFSSEKKLKQDPEMLSNIDRESYELRTLIGGLITLVSVVCWVLLSGALMVHNVGQREVAIVYNFSGTIAGKRDPGVVTTWPWQHVKKENVGILHDEWLFDDNNAAVSIDQQRITSALSVNYQIDAANVVDLYKRVGASWKSIIIDARVPQVFKETTATFTTPELTQKREQLRIATKERLTKELAPYDIKVVDVFIRNLGFSKSYTDAIEAKQKQVQDALTAQAKVDQIEAEANQKVAEAEGEKKSNIIRAEGEAQANRLRSRTLTPLLIRQLAIEKLNDKVQMIICPPQSVCIPNSGVVPVQGGSGG